MQLTVDRLKAIRWTDHEQALAKSFSRAALIREHMRRTALWLNVYGDTEYWPIFDLAAVVAPEVRADPAVIANVEEFVDAASNRWYAVETSVAAVHWTAVADTPGLKLPPLPDPFEPLVRAYERGGLFSFANGFIDFETVMVPCGEWRAHLSPTPVVGLGDQDLDAVDAAGWERFNHSAGRHEGHPTPGERPRATGAKGHDLT
ncbi:hypothetical protein ACGF07_11550 [Kitasatospora sp. NPDC048194]|uniref:hypothetical protein n=1 Tax=Kitasatospora sp. NPDC048194 TaxID=3364045 RepID=UPI00370F8B2D